MDASSDHFLETFIKYQLKTTVIEDRTDIIYVEIIQLWAKFQTAMVLCSRFMVLWPSGLGNYFVRKRFVVQSLLWSLEFVIQINLEHDNIADII